MNKTSMLINSNEAAIDSKTRGGGASKCTDKNIYAYYIVCIL